MTHQESLSCAKRLVFAFPRLIPFGSDPKEFFEFFDAELGDLFGPDARSAVDMLIDQETMPTNIIHAVRSSATRARTEDGVRCGWVCDRCNGLRTGGRCLCGIEITEDAMASFETRTLAEGVNVAAITMADLGEVEA